MSRTFSFMVVEDDADARGLLELVLSADGHRVFACEDGLAAMAAVERGDLALDAVIMDLQMPGLDGIATIRRLRATPSTATVPIVCVTARVERAAREACLAAGCNRILYKPASPEVMLRALSEALREAGKLGPDEALE